MRLFDILFPWRFYQRKKEEFDHARKVHMVSVEGMNRYIGRTERHIAELETALERHVGPIVVKAIRIRNGRTDTRDMVKNRVWDDTEVEA